MTALLSDRRVFAERAGSRPDADADRPVPLNRVECVDKEPRTEDSRLEVRTATPRSTSGERRHRTSFLRRANRSPRRGAVVLEMILAMPLLVVGVMAIVELGLLIANLQHVEFASRNGAIVAAKLPRASLPIAPAAMPVEITTAVVAELQKMNPAITSATIRQIYLEHTADPGGAGPLLVPETITDGASLAPIPYLTVTDPAAAPTLNAYEYVRVTVFVDFSDIAPNLLSTFCIDFSAAVVQQTSTMPYLQP